jgi:nitric oxide reductase large subunit
MKVNWTQLVVLIISWAIGISLAFLLLNSCSIEHHLSKAQKHIDIAKRKGAVIKPDTVWQYSYTKETIFDTVTNTYKEILKKDSSFQTINNTIAPGMSRQERLALEDYYKHLEKMMRLQNDSLGKEIKKLIKINGQNQKTERVIVRQENKQPWAWVILSAVVLAIIIVLKRIFKL